MFILITATFVGAALVYIAYWHTRNIELETLRLSAASYSNAIKSFRSFYSKEILQRIHNSNVEITHDYKDKINAIPIPATMTHELAHSINQNDTRLRVEIVSEHPFPWRKGRALSDFEYRALKEFRLKSNDHFTEISTMGGLEYLLYASPMRMATECVDCHNAHPDTPKNDWRIGDIRGLQIVRLPVGNISSENQLGLAYLIAFIILSFVGAFSVILWLVNRNQVAFAELHTNTKHLERSNSELKFLKDALDNHAIVSIANKDGIITYANKLFCEVSGYTHDELIGKSHNIIRSKEHPKTFFDNMWNTIKSGRIWNGEIKNLAKDGKHYWVNSTIVPYLNEHNEPFQFIAIRTDISLLKELEAETEKSRRFLASITDAIGEGVIAMDAEGYCIFANPEAERLLGWTQKEIFGNSIIEHIVDGPDSSLNLQSTEPFRSDNLCLMRRDGTTFDASFILVPMRDGPEFVGSVTAFHDITDRKKAENALKSSEERFRQVASTAHEAIITTNQDGNIIFWNNAAITTFGYERDEIINKPLETIIPTAHVDAHHAGFSKAVETGVLIHKGETLELPALRKDGTEILTEVILSTWEAEGNRFFTAMGRDITERKQMIEDLENATEQAKNASRAKSDFLANMSHEIRTPMNAIIGLSHLASQTDLRPKQRDYIEKIQNSSKNLLGIINDILDISKIEAGKMELEKIPFNLSQVIDGVIAVSAHKAAEKSIEFLLDIPADVSSNLQGDPLRLGQVLNNLINNAIKFTDHGEVLLSISQEAQNGEDIIMRFDVRDTGLGMSQIQMDKLFQPFTQADVSTTRRYGGTGLGLAITKELVNQMDGLISLESKPDIGSCFTLSIPFQLSNQISTFGDIDTSFTSKRHALVIDDNETAREVLSRTLQSFKIRTIQAASGEEGLELLRSTDQSIDIVLVDWIMPGGMDGINVSREILNDPKISSKPYIILVTSYSRDDARINMEDDPPCQDILQKPINSSDLFNAINPVFGGATMDTSKVASKLRDIEAIETILGARILVAEDNAINQQVICELLEDLGLKVDLADNGQEVVDKAIADNTYDVILMDVQMPELDGFEATNILRSNSDTQGMPIIALTAHSIEGDREECLKAGMDDYISKPIEPDELFETLTRWIKPKQRDFERKSQAISIENTLEYGLPQSLPGINLQQGLHYMGGHVKTYTKLLRQLWQDHHLADEKISDAIETNDISTATRIAHSMKSLSKTLGAEELSTIAQKLELELKNGTISNEILQSFNHHLLIVMDGLKTWDAKIPEEDFDSIEIYSEVDMQKHFDELQQALELGDTAAEELLSTIAPNLKHDGRQQKLNKMVDAIEQFEFDEALEILMTMRKTSNDEK